LPWLIFICGAPLGCQTFARLSSKNIAYGKQGATQQEVEAAGKSAFMDKFIEALPQGYDALVGERGLKLS
jgi:ABC-type multidrug transport system fused ATPase/permease subunit